MAAVRSWRTTPFKRIQMQLTLYTLRPFRYTH